MLETPACAEPPWSDPPPSRRQGGVHRLPTRAGSEGIAWRSGQRNPGEVGVIFPFGKLAPGRDLHTPEMRLP